MRILSIESGTTTISLNLRASVVYEKQGCTQNLYVLANGLLIAKLSGNNKFYHHQDHLDYTRVVTKGSQTDFSTNYKPFGPQYGTSGTDPVYKYTGKPHSIGTQLYYYGARWYNSTTGRFLTRDPSPGRLSNPQSLNIYVYVLNNPLRYTDPAGLKVCGYWDVFCKGSNVVDSVSNGWNSLSSAQKQFIIEVVVAVAVFTAVVGTGGAALPVVLAAGLRWWRTPAGPLSGSLLESLCGYLYYLGCLQALHSQPGEFWEILWDPRRY